MNDFHTPPPPPSAKSAKKAKPALDHLRIVHPPDGGPAQVWAAVALGDLPPCLLALLRLLEEDTGEPTDDGLVAWKAHDWIRQRLPHKGNAPRTSGAVRELIRRLRDEFAQRGLDSDLIETRPDPDRSHRMQTRRWQARLRVRSRVAATGTGPAETPKDKG